MKKKIGIIVTIAICFLTISVGNAAVMVYDNNAGEYYSVPGGNGAIAHSPEALNQTGMDHDYYYYWILEDLNQTLQSGDVLELVFHGVHDSSFNSPDNLAVYISDGIPSTEGLIPVTAGWYGSTLDGWYEGYDNESLGIPEWDSTWTFLGAWEDPVGGSWPMTDDEIPTYDVVYSLTLDPIWIEYLTNGNNFTFGIDPDCHYYFDDITVTAPVPEPATLLLLGTGLIGFAGISRQKFYNKK